MELETSTRQSGIAQPLRAFVLALAGAQAVYWVYTFRLIW